MWDQQNMEQWNCLQSKVSPLDDTKSNISAWNVDLKKIAEKLQLLNDIFLAK